MRLKSAVILLGLVIALVAGIVLADTECDNYPNSRIQGWGGTTYICGFSGPGCTMCWNTGGAGTCVTNGEDCTPQIENRH